MSGTTGGAIERSTAAETDHGSQGRIRHTDVAPTTQRVESIELSSIGAG